MRGVHSEHGEVVDDEEVGVAETLEGALELAVELWPYDAVAERVWQLRANVTVYDGAYAALAETLRVPLITLDRRLAFAPGLGCVVETPE